MPIGFRTWGMGFAFPGSKSSRFKASDMKSLEGFQVFTTSNRCSSGCHA